LCLIRCVHCRDESVGRIGEWCGRCDVLCARCGEGKVLGSLREREWEVCERCVDRCPHCGIAPVEDEGAWCGECDIVCGECRVNGVAAPGEVCQFCVVGRVNLCVGCGRNPVHELFGWCGCEEEMEVEKGD